jgi:alkanesulfonate monooxygenase SsuD/methylene tetrahydromethanopterin reductase-like flavin-dependent oxidoreductase (luciferase family)
VRLGTLVSASTFRRPGQLAVEVATVDQMSARQTGQGRAELGAGARRTPALAARYADEFNGAPGLDLRERYANFRRVCEDVAGRDPAEVRLSATVPTCVGRDAGGQPLLALGQAGRLRDRPRSWLVDYVIDTVARAEIAPLTLW